MIIAETFDINGRPYRAEYDTKGATVVGQMYGRGGILLPGLVDKLVDKLREMGFPAYADQSHCHFDEDQATFAPYPSVSHGWITKDFCIRIKETLTHAEIAAEGARHVRRAELARKVGLLIDEKQWHRDRRIIEDKWLAFAGQEWTTYKHPWKHLEDRIPLNQSSFWRYEWERGGATPADLDWLQRLTEDVERRILNLKMVES